MDVRKENETKLKLLKELRDFKVKGNMSNNDLSRSIGCTPEQAANITLLKINEFTVKELNKFVSRLPKEEESGFDINDNYGSEMAFDLGDDPWKI